MVVFLIITVVQFIVIAKGAERVAELIQTRITLLSEATPLVKPFYVEDEDLEIADDAFVAIRNG